MPGETEKGRLKITIKLIDMKNKPHEIYMWTTQTKVDWEWEKLIELTTGKISSFRIIQSSTKEQHDFVSEFLKERLNIK